MDTAEQHDVRKGVSCSSMVNSVYSHGGPSHSVTSLKDFSMNWFTTATSVMLATMEEHLNSAHTYTELNDCSTSTDSLRKALHKYKP